MSSLLIRSRYVALGLTLALLAGLLAFGRHVQYEQSITSFFAEDDPDVRSYQRASRSFGNDNVVFIAYDDPALFTPGGMDRVAELAAAVAPGRVPAVVGVESLDAMPLLWQVDDNLLALERTPAFLRDRLIRALKEQLRKPGAGTLIPRVGQAVRQADASTLAALKERLLRHPLFKGTLVDDHGLGTSTAIVVRLKGMADQDVKQTVASLRDAADTFARRYRLHRPALVGPPVLLADGFSSIEVDGRRLALVGMILIGLVTLTATRSLWWAVVPILAGWVVWLATETILAALHLKLSLSGGPLVAQIIVLTMPAASHLAIHFRDDLRRNADRRAAAADSMRAVVTPILWCALTGAVGYGALFTSAVVPIRQFGVILAVCTLLAAVLTLTISPVAMLPPFRLEIPVRFASTSRVGRSLNHLTAWVDRHPASIVLVVFAVVIPLTLGMTRLRYESNYINAFKPETRVVRDYHAAERRLGGIGVVSLVLPTEGRDTPLLLADLRALGGRLASIRAGGERSLSQILSLDTVLDPDGRLTALPPEKAAHALATKLDLIAATPQADLLGSFWDRESGLTRVVLRLSEQQSASEKQAIFQAARRQASHGEFGASADLTGLSFLLTQTTRAVVKTSWSTFLWSALGILLMLTIAFRGPRLAVLALLPTLLAVGFVLGLMGWLGIKLDIATALVASVALGLSVDDTFHCLLQFRRHRQASDDFRTALLASYAVTGPGVLMSSLAVAAGFAVLWISEFVPFSNFGAMVGIATLGSSLGNLILLPACLSLGHRWLRRDIPAAVPG